MYRRLLRQDWMLGINPFCPLVAIWQQIKEIENLSFSRTDVYYCVKFSGKILPPKWVNLNPTLQGVVNVFENYSQKS